MEEYMIRVGRGMAKRILDGELKRIVTETAPLNLIDKEEPARCYLFESRVDGGEGMVVGEVLCTKIGYMTNTRRAVARGQQELCPGDQIKQAHGKKCKRVWDLEEPARYQEPKKIGTFGMYAAPAVWCRAKRKDETDEKNDN